MGEFQLILLSEFRNRARAAMAFSLPPQSPAVGPSNDPAWLLPGDALARVQSVLVEREVSIETIVNRLKAGLLRATYETFSWENISRAHTLDPDFIDKKYWGYYPKSHVSEYVWKTADLRLWIGSISGSLTETNVILTFFKVKIERVGIDDIVANSTAPEPRRRSWVKPPPPPAPTPEKPVEIPTVEAPEPEQKGPPVSPEHLKAWFALYQRVYSGAADTEAKALASARGMFPDKSVPRDRVRELRGSQKRGRKAGETAK